MQCCRPLSRRTIKFFLVAVCVVTLIFSLTSVFDIHGGVVVSEPWTFSYKTIIEPLITLKVKTDKSVLVCVTSDIANRNHRDAIRQTWGTYKRVFVVFMLGLHNNWKSDVNPQPQLIKESQEFADIIQYDFEDLDDSIKSVACISWAKLNPWPNRSHVIKIEDAVFFNPVAFFKHSESLNEPAMIGVTRNDFADRLQLPNSQDSKYPLYLDKSFYIIPENIISKLEAFLFNPKYTSTEDIYLTALVAEMAQVKRINFPEELKLMKDKTEFDLLKNQTDAIAILAESPKYQQIFWLACCHISQP